MLKPGTFIFWDASRLLWFKYLLDNIFDPFYEIIFKSDEIYRKILECLYHNGI